MKQKRPPMPCHKKVTPSVSANPLFQRASNLQACRSIKKDLELILNVEGIEEFLSSLK